MTGYGRAEIFFQGDKIVFEIRSVNGKSADIGIKSSLIPKSKDIEIKQLLASHLQRGSIELSAHIEGSQAVERLINKERFMAYYQEIIELTKDIPELRHPENLLGVVLGIPEVMERKYSEPNHELWAAMVYGIGLAIDQINLFRAQEGAELASDMLRRVALIESYVYKVEEVEPLRIEVVKERLLNRLHELNESVQPDMNRFEQELIYYLEKFDITEEKLRLRHHCSFFKQTTSEETSQGRKLSFIAQEMGREINTIGSKANNATMQQWVVMMKDELEKIKEQVMNIL